MSGQESKNLGHAFFEAQDRLKGGPDPALCAPGYSARIGGNPAMTLQHHEAFAKAFYTAFPDLYHVVDETLTDGDRIAVRLRIHGTHTAEFMGIPATRKVFEIGVIVILHVVEGKVAELHGQFDQLGMLRQLGVMQ